jgi:monooxygenase
MTITDNITRTEDFDVLIVGAGLSGIGAAYQLQTDCPNKRFIILEGRGTMGGTWDLFRYPGVRSDSDMYTLGYPFRPWSDAKAIADGSLILNYLRETAEEYGIDKKIRYNHKVKRAEWSSEKARWTLEVEDTTSGASLSFSCNFLLICGGYYDYSQGYVPTWAGMERFTGQVVHPQFWSENFDYTGKRVLIIGSGATAVTLAPAMADLAEHVTILQRSPTYMASAPSQDPLANWLRDHLPKKLAHSISRWQRILLGVWRFRLVRKYPEKAKTEILRLIKEAIPHYDVEKHFSPRYNPWDQRFCLVPDADLFKAINAGKVSIVTDEIESFTEQGIRLKSGEELAADIIVTATGLRLKVAGGVEFSVDGKAVNFPDTLIYKGAMYTDVPNLTSTFGYTNASWTLKADLIARYTCRVINYMDKHGYNVCVPHRPTDEATLTKEPMLNLNSGYIQRANNILPYQSSKAPYKLYHNYLQDFKMFKFGSVNDGTLEFRKVPVGRELIRK